MIGRRFEIDGLISRTISRSVSKQDPALIEVLRDPHRTETYLDEAGRSDRWSLHPGVKFSRAVAARVIQRDHVVYVRDRG